MKLEITSIKNPKVKNILTLQKSRERRQQNLFAVEGIREISLAQQSGFYIDTLFICEEVYHNDSSYPIDIHKAENLFSITKDIFDKVAYRESTGGIIAIVRYKTTSLKELPKDQSPLYLILEKVEKPGNIGAILRTADAAGISGVIICDPATDFYNPNVIRSSVGCVFTVPIASTTNEELNGWLKDNDITSFATMLTAKTVYTTCDYTKPTAFLLGSESQGLSEYWEEYADEKIIIPMQGKIDSMNVSNAAAIVVFEAIRQRSL